MNLCGRGKGGDNGSWWILNALKKKASRKEAILLLLRAELFYTRNAGLRTHLVFSK